MFELKEQHETNVLSLNNARNLRTAAPVSDLFFPVKEYALSDLTGKADRGYKAVVREDTGAIIAVNGSKYNLIPNRRAYDIVDEALLKAKELNTDGMKIIDTTAHQGSTAVRNYIFPSHIAEPNVGDITQLKITVINSYDGTSGLKFLGGGYRLICKNGMVAGTNMSKFSGRHTSGLKLDSLTSRVESCIKAFSLLDVQWKLWADTKCSDTQAKNHIAKLHVSEGIKDTVMAYWHKEKAVLGTNMWALYNALTYYSTHHRISRGAGNEAWTTLSREADVSKVISTFKRAA